MPKAGGFAMNKNDILNKYERLYSETGNYRLRSKADILNIHGFEVSEISGYETLPDKQKELFDKAIINLMNGLGLESRCTFIPTAINYVREIEYCMPDDTCRPIRLEVRAILPDGKIKAQPLYRHCYEKASKAKLDKCKKYIKRYLCIDYKNQGRKNWLHIINENEWY